MCSILTSDPLWRGPSNYRSPPSSQVTWFTDISEDLLNSPKYPQGQISLTGHKNWKSNKVQIPPWIFVLTCYDSHSTVWVMRGIRQNKRTYIWWAGSTIEGDKWRSLHNLLKFSVVQRKKGRNQKIFAQRKYCSSFPVLILVNCENYIDTTANGRGEHANYCKNQLFFSTVGKKYLHKRRFSELHPSHSTFQLFSAKSFSV